ncbi:MAG: Ig-like domain-containing protein, partial [Micrococcales bacterium]|nr:Ig-like domain-containing protein [Micrococcales bacterium]
MTQKTVRALVSGFVVAGLAVVCAPMVGAAPGVSPGSGPPGGGTTVGGGMPAGFAAIAAGDSSGYGLDDGGTAWAWGDNGYGQLGDGTVTGAKNPVRVKAASGTLPPFTAITARSSSAYGLDKNGGIWAWGNNESGQLGDGTTTNAKNPVRVKADSGTLPVFTAITAGTGSAYGLDKNGSIWAWGNNGSGQLGDGTATSSSTPVRVKVGSGTLPPFTAITAGTGSAYGLDKNGGIWAWGNNGYGQLGDGTTTHAKNPVEVKADSGTLPVFTAITAGVYSGYALDKSGGIWAWGYNSVGQLGDGTTMQANNPVRVEAASGALPVFTAITAGTGSAYGLDKNGGVWAWGYNNVGQLGDGTTTNAKNPVQVKADSEALPVFTAITAGDGSGYGLDKDGGVWAWGYNGGGRFGDGTTTNARNPVRGAQVVVGQVTFGGVAGSGLTQSDGRWSVRTPPGCGRVPVVVSYGFGSGTGLTASAGDFEFGKPPAFTLQPASGGVVGGGVIKTTVSVTGDPVPQVRWQSRVGKAGWKDVPGATGVTLSVRPKVATDYRAVATNCWSTRDPSAFTAYSTTVSVVKVKTVALAMKQVTMASGTSLKAVALAYPAGANAKLSWSSTNPKVAKVNKSGKIQALKPGSTVITVKAPGGKTARLKVTVVAKAVKVTTVKAAKTATIKVKKGKTKRLTLTPTPAGATLTKMPTYKSTKPTIATIDKTGLVTAKKKGKTKLTVTLAGKKTTVIV